MTGGPEPPAQHQGVDLASSLLVIWRQAPAVVDGSGGGSAKHANSRGGERAADGLGLLVTADLLEEHGRWPRPRRLRPRRWPATPHIAEEEGGSLWVEIQRPSSSVAIVLTPAAAASSSAGRRRRLDLATPKRNRVERGRSRGRPGGARDTRSATVTSSPCISSTDQAGPLPGSARARHCPSPSSTWISPRETAASLRLDLLALCRRVPSPGLASNALSRPPWLSRAQFGVVV
ncbi:hypothetical protein E2562_035460 [Oryza meyeriana var. granulata]|uniref:Uncharacterized protein n=1 Tax=Oryza meyeriana var. granulata TaxID=110450 RepID=A0A6G1CWL2_9ORYZ|nr:hypothetical protein E2562_035460 [Oryza meyeriana var. granulata]